MPNLYVLRNKEQKMTVKNVFFIAETKKQFFEQFVLFNYRLLHTILLYTILIEFTVG